MKAFIARAVGAWLFTLTVLVRPAAAEDAAPLTLRQAIAATLRDNPKLRTFAFAFRAQDARLRQAALRPAPEVSLDVENVLGTGDVQGIDSAEYTVALSQVIELGNKRGARVAVAEIGRQVIDVERQAAQLDVLAEVTRRFIHVAADQEQIALTRRATELARTTVTAVERRVQAATSPDLELYRARAALSRAEIELGHAEHEVQSSRRKLAAMWGDSAATFGPVQVALYALPVVDSYERLAARLANNPDFLRFATEARLRDAEMRLVQAQRRPSLTVTGGVRRIEAVHDQGIVVGVSLPLFSGRQAAPAIAEAEALRGQVDAERDAALIPAQAQVFELSQELHHAIDEVGTLRSDVLPLLEQALKDTEYAYERGRYSYLELVDGQHAFLDAQRALIEAATNAQILQAEIERLTGEPLTETP
ncbi:MAG: TolC family protein [Gammaproteobacteria bacterium]|nr:TolC family protein [Gammaproteobacteria bacterium]